MLTCWIVQNALFKTLFRTTKAAPYGTDAHCEHPAVANLNLVYTINFEGLVSHRSPTTHSDFGDRSTLKATKQTLRQIATSFFVRLPSVQHVIRRDKAALGTWSKRDYYKSIIFRFGNELEWYTKVKTQDLLLPQKEDLDSARFDLDRLLISNWPYAEFLQDHNFVEWCSRWYSQQPKHVRNLPVDVLKRIHHAEGCKPALRSQGYHLYEIGHVLERSQLVELNLRLSKSQHVPLLVLEIPSMNLVRFPQGHGRQLRNNSPGKCFLNILATDFFDSQHRLRDVIDADCPPHIHSNYGRRKCVFVERQRSTAEKVYEFIGEFEVTLALHRMSDSRPLPSNTRQTEAAYGLVHLVPYLSTACFFYALPPPDNPELMLSGVISTVDFDV
ncbi:hypothetical protein R3P38DRAFT_3182193 [Favolaschia claudopus]|uniref:Uncharacterized protein n=1 Tax=Favolaschia claudopus TaxID=2862362 RepID=A0AAW0CGE7_9AGAR